MKKVLFSILICFIFCAVYNLCYGENTSKIPPVVDTIEVKGEYTFRHCLNECGITHGHYIEFADVMIKEDCISDYPCSQCLDECAEELKENNPELYQSILNHTTRSEF